MYQEKLITGSSQSVCSSYDLTESSALDSEATKIFVKSGNYLLVQNSGSVTSATYRTLRCKVELEDGTSVQFYYVTNGSSSAISFTWE